VGWNQLTTMQELSPDLRWSFIYIIKT
jgi:hypothetical protein